MSGVKLISGMTNTFTGGEIKQNTPVPGGGGGGDLYLKTCNGCSMLGNAKSGIALCKFIRVAGSCNQLISGSFKGFIHFY